MLNKLHMHYEVYGLRLCSDISLPELPRESFHFKDVSFSYNVKSHEGETLLPTNADMLKRRVTTQGGYFALFSTADSYLMRWEGHGEFLVSRDGKTIRALIPEMTDMVWVKGTLYGVVLAFVLHIMGISNLHASGVVLPEGAAGFLADPWTGKSTLAASLVTAGHKFLTDDVLTLQGGASGYEVFPGFPYMSLDEFSMNVIMGPGSSGSSVPGPGHIVEDKERIACADIGGEFQASAVPLKALFILSRGMEEGEFGGQKVAVVRLSRSEALKSLLDNTVFLPLLPVAVTKRHMKFLAELTETLPVWRLRFADGFDNLPEMMAKVLDAAGSPQPLPVNA